MEDRIIKLEVQMETLHGAVERTQSSALALTEEVREIQKTLNQIKYFAMGMAALVVMNDLGITTVLRGLI